MIGLMLKCKTMNLNMSYHNNIILGYRIFVKFYSFISWKTCSSSLCLFSEHNPTGMVRTGNFVSPSTSLAVMAGLHVRRKRTAPAYVVRTLHSGCGAKCVVGGNPLSTKIRDVRCHRTATISLEFGRSAPRHMSVIT